ncbi:DLW-39 family protein [Brachybacterium muris]|uniref:DLW-39 family protein n=1 Tax=Brachybacterium muris TaxID=219301 RepID=UPI00223C482C|nr:DLW-39 family protein [Brachybacterium muris]MCT1996931.1 DLW-39 family protein [Brachybacterium muris]MCT2176537.1 DLW-39 family protein [Brachybacterium muris]MCT2296976.1 DLW-39 family protein [Brachybacterium muris]
MKKFVQIAAVLISSTVAGVLVWRKVESDRLRNDLWDEAESISAEQDAAKVSPQDQPVPAQRG